MTKNILKISALCLLIGSSFSASAQWAVSDAMSQYILNDINTNLKKNITALEAVGNKSDANNKIFNDAAKHDAINKDMGIRGYEAAVRNQPTISKCVDATFAKANAGSRSASTAAAAAAGAYIAGKRESTNPINATEDALAIKKTVPETCTAADVRNSSQRNNGCGAVGWMAGSSRNMGAVFAGAGTGPTTAVDQQGKPLYPAKSSPSYSFDEKQSKVAKQVVLNAVSGIPPQPLPKEVEKTGAGRAYMGLVEKYETRLSAATLALNSILSKSEKPKTALVKGSPLEDLWSKSADVFKELYPERNFSEASPSENEILRLDVFREDTRSYHEAIKKEKGDAAIYHLTHRINLNTKVNFMLLEQMQQLTAIQASLLAHSIEPISAETLKTEYKRAVGTTQ